MSGLILTITNAGRAALVNAANTGTNPVLMASVGVSATAFTPSPGITSLPGEIKRITTIAGEAVADDTIHVTVRDESADVYTVRSFGLYLADGTLFGVYSEANPIMEKSAQAMLLLAIDVIFADIDATQITFGDTSFLNPPATTERQGVVELATESETTSGTDASRAITPKGLKAAVTSWINARFGEGAPSNFVKGLLTAASAAALRTALGLKSAALKDEGAGSGLDADLLDGRHASDFLGTNSVSANAFYAANVIRGGWFGILFGNVGTAPAMIFNEAGAGGLYAESNGWRWYWDGVDIHIGATTGRKIWHAANDGAGSGLDADLLDGQHGSFYRSASNLNDGTVPKARLSGIYDIDISGNAATATKLATARTISLNGDVTGSAAFDGSANSAIAVTLVAAKVLEKLVTVDGSGSGLDADMLDGRHASDFLGTNSVSGNAFYAANVIRGGWYGILFGNVGTAPAMIFNEAGAGGLYAESNGWRWYWDGVDIHIGATTGRKIWHAANDGAGSGLDADLLDGFQASDFQRIVSQNMAEVNGYRVYADGTKECWTKLTIGQDAYATWTLPVPHTQFVNPSFAVSTGAGIDDVQGNTGISNVTLTSITFWNADNRTITIWVRTLGK